MPSPSRTKTAILTVSVWGLAACATVPDLGSGPDPKGAQSYVATESFAAPGADWPADGWWNAYADPQLSALIKAALQDAPSMAQAQARIAKSEAQSGAARAAYLPTLAADGSYAEVKE